MGERVTVHLDMSEELFVDAVTDDLFSHGTTWRGGRPVYACIFNQGREIGIGFYSGADDRFYGKRWPLPWRLAFNG